MSVNSDLSKLILFAFDKEYKNNETQFNYQFIDDYFKQYDDQEKYENILH
jgi:hypothetical protein